MHSSTFVSIAAGKNIPQFKTTIGFKQGNLLTAALLKNITNDLVVWLENLQTSEAHHFLIIKSTLYASLIF